MLYCIVLYCIVFDCIVLFLFGIRFGLSFLQFLGVVRTIALYCIVSNCIALSCIVLYCICLGSTFCNQANLVGDWLSAISGSCLELGGRAVVTVWLPRRCDDVVGAVARPSRYRGGRGVICIVLYCIVLYCIVLFVLYCIVLYCIVLYCIVLYCIVL